MSRHRRLTTLAVVPLALMVLAPVGSVLAADTISVSPGESIQAAIDPAPDGATIAIAPGTYEGNLEIIRSLHLVGPGAIVVPATTPTTNTCVGPLLPGVTGLCIHGGMTDQGTITTRIADVSVEGITVQGFSGPGIIVAGVDGFTAADDVVANNGFWGLFVSSSSDITLTGNTAYGNGSDGIHVDSAPKANAVIVGNSSYANVGTGILFLDALGGRIARNDVHDDCAGMLIAATGTPGQEGGGNVTVELNEVTANNRLCPAQPGQAPAYGGVGIAIIGAKDTIVELNDIRDNVEQTGSGIAGGGIVLLDAKMFGAGAPTGITVTLDRLSGNGPNDIHDDGSGTGNTVSGNTCTTTDLKGAC